MNMEEILGKNGGLVRKGVRRNRGFGFFKINPDPVPGVRFSLHDIDRDGQMIKVYIDLPIAEGKLGWYPKEKVRIGLSRDYPDRFTLVRIRSDSDDVKDAVEVYENPGEKFLKVQIPLKKFPGFPKPDSLKPKEIKRPKMLKILGYIPYGIGLEVVRAKKR